MQIIEPFVLSDLGSKSSSNRLFLTSPDQRERAPYFIPGRQKNFIAQYEMRALQKRFTYSESEKQLMMTMKCSYVPTVVAAALARGMKSFDALWTRLVWYHSPSLPTIRSRLHCHPLVALSTITLEKAQGHTFATLSFVNTDNRT